MTKLEKNALGKVPLTAATVEDIYRRTDAPNYSTIRALCESHRRLQMELEGVSKLSSQPDGELEMTADKLSTVWLLLDDIARSDRDSDATRMAAAKILRDQQCPGWKDQQ